MEELYRMYILLDTTLNFAFTSAKASERRKAMELIELAKATLGYPRAKTATYEFLIRDMEASYDQLIEARLNDKTA